MQRVEVLTHHGMGRLADGSLLPRTLPGEMVEVAEDGSVRILEPSADRVAAPCRHFKACGGCAMQHASDEFVASWKTDIVRKALKAQGLDTDFRPIATSPPQSRRRAKLSGKRTKKGAMIGFHARASDTIIPVPDCQLLDPRMMALMPALEELTVISASRKGEIGLIVTVSDAGPDIVVETTQDLTSQLRITLANFAQAQDIARLTWNEEPVVMRVPPHQRFGRCEVLPPPGAFLQATQHGQDTLVAAVREITQGAADVVDLFAGCGTFALPLSETAQVHAVEGEAAMLTALDQGWRKGQHLRRVTHDARDLFRRPLEPDELARFDAAVIDPPRAGAEAQIRTLAKSQVDTIAMVSCNPVTFARDAATLVAAGFSLNWVQVVDQFRWAAHVEVAASFTRA